MAKPKGRWFRFYVGAMHDPKILAIPDNLFRFWVDLMCIVGADEDADGSLPSPKAVALTLRLKEGEVIKRLEALSEAGLVDKAPSIFSLHNWKERQFRTDNSGADRSSKSYHKKQGSNAQSNVRNGEIERQPSVSVSGSESVSVFKTIPRKGIDSSSIGTTHEQAHEDWHGYDRMIGRSLGR